MAQLTSLDPSGASELGDARLRISCTNLGLVKAIPSNFVGFIHLSQLVTSSDWYARSRKPANIVEPTSGSR